ncbi:hypothetical protein CEXT_499651 [Caerostris extrusa]|uniref:Uncharacterized protein n=1 Tax=Caerostris extrusa TaxID=172846 RepID=A0AAV4XWQ1_CAEEX|nr:hypothetical protein CEXT_499651 [Caerostris extrusa]
MSRPPDLVVISGRPQERKQYGGKFRFFSSDCKINGAFIFIPSSHKNSLLENYSRGGAFSPTSTNLAFLRNPLSDRRIKEKTNKSLIALKGFAVRIKSKNRKKYQKHEQYTFQTPCGNPGLLESTPSGYSFKKHCIQLMSRPPGPAGISGRTQERKTTQGKRYSFFFRLQDKRSVYFHSQQTQKLFSGELFSGGAFSPTLPTWLSWKFLSDRQNKREK